MFRIATASKALQLVAKLHGFDLEDQWQPRNLATDFWSLPPDAICAQLQDAAGRTYDVSVRELRQMGEIIECSKFAR